MKKCFFIAFICTFIDQLVKIILTNCMNVLDSVVVIKSFFNISLVLNTGAAFSILTSKVNFLIIVSVLVLIFLLFYIINDKNIKNYEYIIYGFLIGGICGNLIDRILYGAVIDYLDFNIFNYNFPIFNFADICIVLSMFFILFLMVKDGINEISSRG